MNQQPSENVSQIIALLFMVVSVFGYFFSKPKKLTDYFEIGYISEERMLPSKNYIISKPVIKSPSSSPKKRPQVKKQSAAKTQKPKQTMTDFQKECIQTLQSLGMSKSEATTRMYSVFKLGQPKTIEDFILGAFKREHN